MSAYDGYDDEPRRYRNVQTRPGRYGEPDYVREETYIERGKGPGPRPGGELVYRGREDSIEDIPRDFPPPSAAGGRDRDYRRSSYRSARSEYDRGGYSDDYEEERYSSYTGAGAGRRRRRTDRDYESEYSDSPPRSARSGRSDKKERRKSGFEEVLGGLGLGAVAGALTGKKKNRSRSRSSERSARTGRSRSRATSRRRAYSEGSRSGSRGRDGKRNTEKKWAQAAQAALIAGAVEAFRSRKEPGPWNGEKGKRVATAALSSGGIDGLLDRNPNEKTKRHLAEAVIGGLAVNRLANGPRSKSRGRDRDGSPDSFGPPRSRSRSIIDRFRGRSQSRTRSLAGGDGGGGDNNSTLKKVVAAGGVAAAGKAIYDRVRSKSRNRRSPSRDSSADSYVPYHQRNRDKRRSRRSDMGQSRDGGQDRGRSRDLGSRDTNDNGNGDGTRDLAVAGAAGAGAGALAKSGGQSEKGAGEADDTSSTSDMEAKRKKMKGKELLTAGLATVATIHAVHGVYSSMEAHEKRHKLVAEGEMSPEEARKKQTKAWVQDAASVGIAALGIKGAFSEWKEMKEHREEIHGLERRKRERRKRREERERQEEKDKQERMMRILEQNPQMGSQMAMMQQNGMLRDGLMPHIPQVSPAQGRYQPPPADQSGNPYAPQNGGGGGGY